MSIIFHNKAHGFKEFTKSLANFLSPISPGCNCSSMKIRHRYFKSWFFLPRLLQRSLFNDIPRYVTMGLIHTSFWHQVKKSVLLKFKIISNTCIYHVCDVVLTLFISYEHVRYHFVCEALLFQIKISLL